MVNQPGCPAQHPSQSNPHRRIPPEPGRCACWPALADMPAHIERNRQHLAQFAPALLDLPGRAWRQRLRTDLLPNRPHQCPIILTGHQPGFLHPGILAKYALLTHLAKHTHALALNLVVDNDLPRHTELHLPVYTDNTWQRLQIPLSPILPRQPMENQPGPTVKDLDQFARTLSTLSLPWLACDALPRILAAMHAACAAGIFPAKSSLAAFFAVLTRQLADDLGLQWIDIPISRLSDTDAFLAFAAELLRRDHDTWLAYNHALHDYRRNNHQRSAARPAPDLADDPDARSREMPFWVFRENQTRHGLQIQRTDHDLLLRDALDHIGRIPLDALRHADHAIPALRRCLDESNARLRPRAITLTAFARLYACDYFIHGLGGAKYENVTDAFLQKFFHVEPPAFALATATFYPPIPDVPSPNQAAQQLHHHQRLARDLIYNPQRYIHSNDPAVQQLLQQRTAAIQENNRLRTARADRAEGFRPAGILPAESSLSSSSPSASPAADQRRQLFDRIRSLNEQLQPFTHPTSEEAQSQLHHARHRLEQSRITHDRTLFFGLLPPNDLQSLHL